MSWLVVTMTTVFTIRSETFFLFQNKFNSRTFPTIYTELEKAEFPLLGILEDTLLDEECNDHGYVCRNHNLVSDIFLIPK